MATLSKESVMKLPRRVTFGLGADARTFRTRNVMLDVIEQGYVICYPLYPEPGENKSICIIPVPGTRIESVL